MTSGNLSDEPIAYRQRRRRSRGSAASPTSSSCTTARSRRAATTRSPASSPARPTLLRRSRGYVPRADRRCARRSPQPVLACGAQLKNTFCLGRRRPARTSGPHIGDLENLETFEALRGGDRARWSASSASGPRSSPTTCTPTTCRPRYALARGRRGARSPCSTTTRTSRAPWPSTASSGPVLGVAYDGTGYGTDGTAWGGEVLLADYARLRAPRDVPADARSPAATRAIREPWRIALALLDDAFDGEPPLAASRRSSAASTPATSHVVRRMLARGFNTRRRTASGRYFDAFGALVLGRPDARYEGQVALALERGRRPGASAAATRSPSTRRARRWSSTCGRRCARPSTISLGGRAAARSPARFHNTLAAAHRRARARRAAGARRPAGRARPAAASRTRCLAEAVVDALRPDRAVFLHRQRAAGRRRHRARPGGRRRRAASAGLKLSRQSKEVAACVSAFPAGWSRSTTCIATVDFWGVRRAGAPRPRRRAGRARRLHPQPRRLRHPPHPARGRSARRSRCTRQLLRGGRRTT